MNRITLFEDLSLDSSTNLFAGFLSEGGELSQRICGDAIDTKIDKSCGCSQPKE